MWRAVTAVAERHWRGASRCDPATDLAFPRPFALHPPWPVASRYLREPYCRVSRQKTKLRGDFTEEIDDCFGKLSNRVSVNHRRESQDMTSPVGR